MPKRSIAFSVRSKRPRSSLSPKTVVVGPACALAEVDQGDCDKLYLINDKTLRYDVIVVSQMTDFHCFLSLPPRCTPKSPSRRGFFDRFAQLKLNWAILKDCATTKSFQRAHVKYQANFG
jgi:hypothetical protein